MVIPPHLREKIWKEGPDAAYPEMKALFEMTFAKGRISYNSAVFDHRWNTFRAWFGLAVGSWFGAEYAIETIHKAKDYWEQYESSEDDLEDAERQIAAIRAQELTEHAREAAAEKKR